MQTDTPYQTNQHLNKSLETKGINLEKQCVHKGRDETESSMDLVMLVLRSFIVQASIIFSVFQQLWRAFEVLSTLKDTFGKTGIYNHQ